jgi:histidyl-tRNA synthetase
VDIELLLMCARLWRELQLPFIRLELNTLGSPEERRAHRESLVSYLRGRYDELDEDSRRRLETNPLRVLDSKNPSMKSIIEGAPALLGFVQERSLRHFEAVKSAMREADIAFEVNPRLVRGLDYYNLTVFEWVTDRLGSQGTVCGGGRYDGLFEQLGGKPTPAAGFAMGIERLLDLLREAGRRLDPEPLDAYLVHQGERAERLAVKTAEILRDAGLAVAYHVGGGSFKAQMRKADASGACVAVIIGDDEADRDCVAIKPLRKEEPQRLAPVASVVQAVREQLQAPGS